MIDSVLIGTASFLIIVAIDKLLPDAKRWKKALATAVLVAIAVAIWLAVKPE